MNEVQEVENTWTKIVHERTLEIENLREQLAKLDNAKLDLERENDNLKEKVDALKTEKQILHQQKNELKTRYKTLYNNYEGLSAKNDELQEELEHMQELQESPYRR